MMRRTLSLPVTLVGATAVLTAPCSAQIVLEPEFEPTGEERGVLPLLAERLSSWGSTPEYTVARVFRFDDRRYVVLGNGASDGWTPMPGRTPWSIQMIGLDVPENPPYLLGMSVRDGLLGTPPAGPAVAALLIDDFDADGDLDVFACAPWPGMRRPHAATFDGAGWRRLDQTSVETPGCASPRPQPSAQASTSLGASLVLLAVHFFVM